jgi:spoIIIJ-associated protein
MNARERRVLHLALRDDPAVKTSSEGEGPDRAVVIYPA